MHKQVWLRSENTSKTSITIVLSKTRLWKHKKYYKRRVERFLKTNDVKNASLSISMDVGSINSKQMRERRCWGKRLILFWVPWVRGLIKMVRWRYLSGECYSSTSCGNSGPGLPSTSGQPTARASRMQRLPKHTMHLRETRAKDRPFQNVSDSRVAGARREGQADRRKTRAVWWQRGQVASTRPYLENQSQKEIPNHLPCGKDEG